MNTEPLMKCRYCKGSVYFEPGFTQDSDGEVAHEECLQQSGDDYGAIKLMYKSINAQDGYIEYFLNHD